MTPKIHKMTPFDFKLVLGVFTAEDPRLVHVWLANTDINDRKKNVVYVEITNYLHAVSQAINCLTDGTSLADENRPRYNDPEVGL